MPCNLVPPVLCLSRLSALRSKPRVIVSTKGTRSKSKGERTWSRPLGQASPGPRYCEGPELASVAGAHSATSFSASLGIQVGIVQGDQTSWGLPMRSFTGFGILLVDLVDVADEREAAGAVVLGCRQYPIHILELSGPCSAGPPPSSDRRPYSPGGLFVSSLPKDDMSWLPACLEKACFFS